MVRCATRCFVFERPICVPSAVTIGKNSLPAGKSEHLEFDDEIAGFFLRIRAGGSRTFGYQFRVGRKNRRLTLGTAVKEAFPDIRTRVLILQAQVRLGIDPAGTTETKRREADQTFGRLVDQYIADRQNKWEAAPMTSARDEWIEKRAQLSIEQEIGRRGYWLVRRGAELVGPCPSCGGTDRFAVNEQKGIWNCRGCDKGGDVIEMVRHLDGCTFEQAITYLTGEPPPKPNDAAGNGASRSAGSWVCLDANGNPFLKVDRYNKAGGDKGYQQFQWDGTKWINGKPAGPKIPYRLPELLDSDRSEPVYICEDEKCADALAGLALAGLGLAATTASEGAAVALLNRG
jgi:hypothetical protein